MLKSVMAFAAAASMAASPCLSAELDRHEEIGARRSGAGVGAYLAIPLGGPRHGRTQSGLRISVSHDYRDARNQSVPVVRSDVFDLRLIGDQQPTLYVAGQAVTGEAARRNNLFGTSSIVTVAVLTLAVIGAIVVWKEIDDDDDQPD